MLKIEEDDLKLLDVYFKIVNANKNKGLKWNDYLGGAEGLATKCYFHISTAFYLFNRTKIPENKIELVDGSSINVLTRSALETLLTFAYIYILPNTEEERDFTFQSWVIGDLLIRQDIAPLNEEHKNILKEDKIKIDEYRSNIKKSPFFTRLKKDHRVKILKGEWRLDKWVKIGKKLGFDDRIISRTYSYLSSYAHSGFLSILQLQTAVRKGEETPPLEVIKETLRIVLANMIDNYCILFLHPREELYRDSRGVSLVQKYLKATGIEGIYSFKYDKEIVDIKKSDSFVI